MYEDQPTTATEASQDAPLFRPFELKFLMDARTVDGLAVGTSTAIEAAIIAVADAYRDRANAAAVGSAAIIEETRRSLEDAEHERALAAGERKVRAK